MIKRSATNRAYGLVGPDAEKPHTPRRMRVIRSTRTLSLPAAALILGGLLMSGSLSAFSSPTDNAGNTLEAAASFATNVSILDPWTTGTTHTVSAGSDRLLLVAVFGEDGGVADSVNTVTWGGQTLTEIDEVVVGAGPSNISWLGYLDEAGIAAGSGDTIIATWSGFAPDRSISYAAVTLENVDQATPIGGSSTGTALNAGTVQPVGALSADPDDLAVYVTVSAMDTETHTEATGYTEGVEQIGGAGPTGHTSATAHKEITTAGSEQPIANWSNSNARLAIISTIINSPASPAISGLVPSSGPEAGGTSVVISGTAFTGATAVSFGATPATGYVVDSDTQITATSPAGTGVVDVTVTTPLGTSANTSADDYTFTTDVGLANSWTTGLTHVAGTGSNRLLVFVAGMENDTDRDLTAVSYGGQTMTQANEGVICTTICARNEVWYLDDAGIQAATGTTFVPTWGGTPSNFNEMYAAVTLHNVDQITPIGNISSAGGTGNPIQVATALNVNIGNMVLTGATSGNAGSYTPDIGYIEGTDQAAASSTTATAYLSITTGGTQQPSATYDAAVNRQTITGTIINPTLNPPTDLTATCGTSKTLNWTATVDTYATGHRVLRSATPGGPYTQIAEVTPRTTTTYVDSPAPGFYYYVVRAYYQSQESVDSIEAAGPLDCPTFGAVADTWAKQDKNPDTNYGTDVDMDVKSQSTKENRSFVRFDISSIAAGSTVNSATLTTCATAVPGVTRTYDVHQVTSSWVETTLTWNLQPTVAATATDSTTTPAAPGCMTWTVTADVQAWIDGTTNNGWRISDSVIDGDNNTTKFRTREDGTVDEVPKLVVDYSP